jgi:hypothetical protein
MAAPDRLPALRAETAARLAAQLAAGDTPLPELRELQERLKLLDAALAEQRTRNEHRLGALLWPMLLVAALLLLAATVPVPSVPLSLELKASSVTLDLAEPGTIGPHSVDGELRVEGFGSLESADTALAGAAAREHAERVAIRSGQTRLRGLGLPGGARLTLQARGEAVALEVDSARAPVIADVEVRGNTTLRLGEAGAALERVFEHSEWLRLIGGDAAQTGQAAPPMSLWLPRRGDATLHFDGLRPSTLRFAERREGAGAGAVSGVGSSLDGGTLNLPASGQTLQINGGDWLQIDGLTVERCELIAGAQLLIKLSGSARVLRLRVGEFERSLKPSWLEYASRHHGVSLLWGAAALLWGALAWLRQHFAGAWR